MTDQTNRRWATSTLFVGLVLLTTLGSVLVSPTAAAAIGEGVPKFGHVFVIIGENTDLSQMSRQNAPYVHGTSEPESSWLTNYFAVTHYSEANYVAMTSGQFTACQQVDGSPASCHQNVDNLFHQLDSAGTSWQSWMESMPTPCGLVKTGTDAGLDLYAPKHNPAIDYDSIEGPSGIWNAIHPSSECLTRDIPTGSTDANNMTAFDAALASGNIARFNLVVPNECEDGHDNCKPAGNPIAQYDAFLAREVPSILASPAFGSDGVLIVTFDEGITNGPHHAARFGEGAHVAFAIVSPM